LLIHALQNETSWKQRRVLAVGAHLVAQYAAAGFTVVISGLNGLGDVMQRLIFMMNIVHLRLMKIKVEINYIGRKPHRTNDRQALKD
jgi:hypothetical protein